MRANPMTLNRIDPVLRAVATTRTDLSREMIEPTRDSLNERRRAAVAATDTAGVQIHDTVAGAVPVRVYCGGPSPAPAAVYCHAGAFVLGNLDIDHRQCIE